MLFSGFYCILQMILGFPGSSVVNNLPAMQETRVQSLRGTDPLEKEMAPMPVFLLAKSHGQRSLASYSPWVAKELDMT